MRYNRRLPPLLRVASILGQLISLATIALAIVLAIVFFVTSQQSFPYLYLDSTRWVMIALNLISLSGACSVAVFTYNTRFLRPDGRPFPLDSWQSQVRAIVLLSALPLCALALVLFIPPTSRAFEIVFPITIIAAVVLFVALTTVYAANNRPMRTPRAQ